MRRLAGVSGIALMAAAGGALAEVPSVAVDIAPVHSLVARVMEGVGEPALVLPPVASPHSHALRPSEAAALEGADLVVWIGPELTPWLEDAIDRLAGDAQRLTLLWSAEAIRLETRTGATFAEHDHGHDDHGHDDHGHDDHGHDDHGHDHGHDGHGHDHGHDDHGHDDHGHDHAHDEHGHDEHGHDEHGHDDHDHDHDDHAHDHAHDDHGHDDHGHDDHGHDDHGHDDHEHAHSGTDPHAWLSPSNAHTWLGEIAETLAALDPGNAAAYRANAAAARAEIDALTAEIDARMEPLRGRPFIVFHDAYQYFEQDFGLQAAGSISLSDASEPSPARVAEIRDLVAGLGAACVFAEPQFNRGLVDAVFEGSAANVGVIDPVGATLTPGPDFYGALIRGMAESFEACF
ncbi:zinc ABC transporter substrate-binding protein [Roseicyclus sp.]|uniref:zinc ABC transporter substrate-binding protein n=1 Tax=Roseicyclus sp. TaxID=1914329 RepID=UPI003F9ED8AF